MPVRIQCRASSRMKVTLWNCHASNGDSGDDEMVWRRRGKWTTTTTTKKRKFIFYIMIFELCVRCGRQQAQWFVFVCVCVCESKCNIPHAAVKFLTPYHMECVWARARLSASMTTYATETLTNGNIIFTHKNNIIWCEWSSLLWTIKSCISFLVLQEHQGVFVVVVLIVALCGRLRPVHI